MGSYASMLNNTPWPLVLVCISHYTGLEKTCEDKWCPEGDHCLKTNGTFRSMKYSLSLTIKGVGTIVGPYGVKKRLELGLFSGATADSNNIYPIDGSSDDYKDVKLYLNQMSAHQKATDDGIAYGETFITAIRNRRVRRDADLVVSIASLIVSIIGTTYSILSYYGGPASINYGKITEITFEQSALAISRDNFEKLLGDTDTTLTELKDAWNHKNDTDKVDYKTLLMQSQDHALQAYNRVKDIDFPSIFEWWKPILYMQLSTVRLAALISLQHLEVIENSTSTGFLTSAKDCLEVARNTSANLITRSPITLMHWFQRDIASHFDSNNYNDFVSKYHLKINDLKAKYEDTWDAILKLVSSSDL